MNRNLFPAAVFVCCCLAACGGANGDTAGTPEGQTGCGSTSSRVGHTATLTTRYHGVSGTAEVVDDCTLVLRNFNYDGAGLDVRLYGARGGDYRNGVALTGDLKKAGGYRGEELRIALPVGTSLDDVDSISVWCVTVAESFGDGAFSAPQ